MLRARNCVIALVLLLGIAMAPRPGWAQDRGRDASPAAVAAGPQRITVTVNGLSCPFCAYGLEKRFKKLPGLDSLHIEFQTGGVALFVRDGSKVSDERIHELVKQGGFEATAIERTSLATVS